MTLTRHSFLSRTVRRCCIVVAAAVLAGCSSVTLVSSYDDQIDTGTTQILADTTAFVNKMIPLAGTPAGEFQSNKDFYSTEEGKIAALEARAEAHRVLSACPSSEAMAKALQAFKPSLDMNMNGYLQSVPKDDCEVALLQQLDAAFRDLEKLHIAQGSKGLPASVRGPILDAGIGAIAKTIITVEVAKKTTQSGGTSNGS